MNTFNSDGEGWKIYDYERAKARTGSPFPVSWEKTGGVGDSGYVWSDDSRWTIDTPENPHSILAFFIYRRWLQADELDLRNAKVSVHLRGEGLDLKGGRCLFWVVDHQNGTRWHYKGNPLTVHEGSWGQKQTFILKNDESLWHRSWSRNPSDPASLDHVLRECDSYGFSFVGFSAEVTGKILMDELVIELAGE